MVVEMTSLQGVMGREYALRSGETMDVALAIEEHYWPKGAGDPLPETAAGLVVGLADRLDSLVGLFAAGLAPTGSSDPFGLRRSALGIVQLLLGKETSLDLRICLQAAAELQPIGIDEDVLLEVRVFIAQRLRGVLRDAGYRHDVVDAVLAVQGHDPYHAQQSTAQLADWTAREDWDQILDAYARCVRMLSNEHPESDVNEAEFIEEAERELCGAVPPLASFSSVDDFLAMFASIVPIITRFFDEVLVMDEDLDVRANRLALVQRVGMLADGIIDLSKLDGF
jgi:glycyl-tRNA synthetase